MTSPPAPGAAQPAPVRTSPQQNRRAPLEGSKPPLEVAQDSLTWYRVQARKARLRYQVLEVLIVIASASVVVLGLVFPTDARPAGVAGAAVAAITVLRSIFHWGDNWRRFTLACSSLTAAITAYERAAPPYESEQTADDLLLQTVASVEHQESLTWSTLPGPEAADSKKG